MPTMSDEKSDAGKERDWKFAKRRRAYRDAKATQHSPAASGSQSKGRPQPPEQVLLYGLHTVRAAMDNPRRSINRMHATRNALSRLEVVSREEFDAQAEILGRTRAKVNALETQLETLTQELESLTNKG